MIHWILLGVLCIALIALSYYSPKLGFGLLGTLALLLGALYYLDPWGDQANHFDIDPDLVALQKTSMTGAYGDSWNYKGRVTNNSSSALTDIQIKITMRDCATEDANPDECVIIGEEVDFVPIVVPPRQARDFINNVSFKHANPKGFVRWSFEVAGIRISR